MSKFELKLPQMGESVAEATLTAWLKDVGDPIEADEAIFEIATDKVDSEVPSEVDGVLLEKRFEVDEVVKVGQVVAVIQVDGSDADTSADAAAAPEAGGAPESRVEKAVSAAEGLVQEAREAVAPAAAPVSKGGRFYSPLVRNMASEEGIDQEELDQIPGSGKDGRVTKADMLAYIQTRGAAGKEKTAVSQSAVPDRTQTRVTAATAQEAAATPGEPERETETAGPAPSQQVREGDEVIPMTRMGKLIAKHMAESVATSAHVQSFVEVDVSQVVAWRERVKEAFEKREGEKLTYTPIFMEAVASALKKYPMMNISVDGDRVIRKKQINIGMAAALPDGNLIVPVIRNADQLNLVGMAKAVNDLAKRARNNALKPDEIKEGTYTVTNVGSFGSVFGTPIINQPQVGILALGAIRKVPSVIETPEGDFIGIRSKMFLSHSYDHRVVNGALGGMFVKAVADYLEAWDPDREI